MEAITFKEYRSDGWPLCPNCGNDELYCPYIADFYKTNGRMPTIDECVELGLRCYLCQQDIPGLSIDLLREIYEGEGIN